MPDQERRRYRQLTPEETHDAAMAVSGQRRPMTLDDFDLSDAEKEGLRGHFDANGASGKNARINGEHVQVNRAATGRKPKNKE